MRALFNKDIATGLLAVSDDLTTVGPSSTFDVKNAVPERPEPRCYILMPGTCTPEQYATVLNGTAVVKDYFVVGVEEGNSGRVFTGGRQYVLNDEGRLEL
jgi:hypothetical protein